MEWTPLVSNTMFTGIKADMGTAAVGIMAVCLIILGIGLLMRVLGK